MATIVKMPQLAAGGEDAKIQVWLVAAGDEVAAGQPIVEIETEKAVVEFEADAAGVVAGLLFEEGDTVPVGKPIAVIATDGEPAEDALAQAPGGAAKAEPESEPAERQATEPASPRVFASPLARKLAREHGLEVADLEGTGPNGRIVRRDVERHLEARPAAAPAPAAQASAAAPAPATPTPQGPGSGASTDATFDDVPHTGMRRAIARRLAESKQTIPHFYLRADVRVDALLELRAQANEGRESRLSVNDFIVKAVGAALVRVPEANAIWTDEATRRFGSVDLAVAVSVPNGLVTPVVRAVETKSVAQLSTELRDLAGRAREGRLKQHELEGGAFSVSNLGMFGTREFAAIINPPQSGILAVGAAEARPVVGENGQLEVGQVLTVTLSADHRVLDGALAAQWLAAFVEIVEHPLQILL
ncbi:dihydrolipoamide acetyltransferase family protein [Gulosibacter faecalis]|uniref:Dihydrolipoamide acetyltransferase component of pyruvate dehydrogenase complex n=1 Tax=Gulosibacter faecalis TaxID=272240 RepID=A0ABW5UYB9_9MICO|nr:dihydrolipoamide acetyltransferase family protein [Gulosibacter faecalis]